MSATGREKGKGTKVGALHFRLMYKAGAGARLLGYEALTISSSASGEWRSLEPRPRQINGLV